MPTTNYPPDPGDVFATDVHRRVLGHIPIADEEALTPDDFYLRLLEDPDTMVKVDGVKTFLTQDQVKAILDDLTGDGYVSFGKFERTVRDVNGRPILLDRERQYEPAEGYNLTKGAVEALSAPLADEPPPLTGEALKAAEARTAEMVEEDDAMEKAAAERRVDEIEAELVAAKETVKELK